MDHLELVQRATLVERIQEQAVPRRRIHRDTRSWDVGFTYARIRTHNALMLLLGDALALLCAFLGAAALHAYWLQTDVAITWAWFVFPLWFFGAALSRLLPSWGLGPVEELRRLTILLATVFGISVTILFLGDDAGPTSRLTLVLAFAFSIFLVPFLRSRIKKALSSQDQWGVPAVVYGAGRFAADVIRMLQAERGLGYNPVAVLDDNPQYWGREIEGVTVLGHTEISTPHAPVAILAMPGIGRARQIDLLEGPLSYYRNVLVIPDLLEAPSLWVRPRDLNGILGLEITSNLTSPFAQLVKRSADLFLVWLTAPLWAPLCLLVAGLIWLEDRHSPLFKQKRVGLDGQIFETWKFRTMVPNAEMVLRRRLEEDEALRMEWETSYKLEKDPRITRIGQLLRKASLDELPQLINVLRGQMSLVGPRPLPHYHHFELADRVRELRSRVRPGITGLWQVSGRSDAGTEGMEQWDPYYVRNWSLWLDAVVLVRTFRAVLKGTGAY